MFDWFGQRLVLALFVKNGVFLTLKSGIKGDTAGPQKLNGYVAEKSAFFTKGVWNFKIACWKWGYRFVQKWILVIFRDKISARRGVVF